MTQKELILQYFSNNPNKDIPHAEVVDWATQEWKKQTGEVFRDPDRAIRQLYGEGKLIKQKKGVYRYDPARVSGIELEEFTPSQKEEILKRDGYKCCICGQGEKHGVELHIVHIKPKDKGGKAILENGQVLCATHNFRKKTYSQTESGKRMFINLLRLSEKQGDEELADFCREVLKLYDAHDINGHIEW